MRPTAYSIANPPAKGSQPPPNFKVGKDGKRRIETANVKALADLKTGLVNNARFGKMAMYSIECIGKMAVDQTTVEEICESGTIEASLQCCLQNKKNESLQHQTNKTILKSALINPECTIAISSTIKQDFSAFKYSISNHGTDETLTSTAEILALLATAPEPEGEKNRQAMRTQGIYDNVAEKIASGSITDPNTLAALTKVLTTGASDSNTAQNIIDQGVFQQLMRQIEQNPNNIELARAFAALVSAASKAGDHIIAQLKQLGVPGILSKILTRFPHDKAIIQSITEAMGGLSSATDVAPLMAVLRDTNSKSANGLSDEEMLRQKLEASARLATLTMVKQNLAFFKGGKGIDDVLASYNALISDLRLYNSPANLESGHAMMVPSILLEGITQTSILLANISNKGAETQRYAILTHGGVDSLTGALQALRVQYNTSKDNGDFKTQAKVVDAIAASLDALTALMSRKENVQFLEQHGAIQSAIMAVGDLAIQHPAVLESLLDMILKALEHFDELSPETIQTMLDALLDIIRSGKIPSDPETARKLAQAMCMLAVDENAEKAIVASGGVSFLLSMLEKHKNDPAVVSQVLQALELALQTQEGMDKFIKAGGEEILRQLKQLYKDDPEICSLIDNLLRMCKEYREGKTVFSNTHGTNAQNGNTDNSTGANGQNAFFANSEGNLMLAGLLGQTMQPSLPPGPLPQLPHSVNYSNLQSGLTSLDIEDEINMGQQRQGMNNLSIEDEEFSAGLDIMQQLRGFGLGAGLSADLLGGMGSMGQYATDPNALTNLQSTSTIMTTSTQLMENSTDPMALQAQHLINTINQVQLYITERRAAKLLSLFETLFMQQQSYDRDYLLNAVLDGLAAICEEGFECEQEILRQNGAIPFEIQPYVNLLGYSNVLNELEQGLIENQVGQRLCQRILQTDDELDIAICSDNFATILSLITRDCVTLIHVKFGLKPQINPNVETDGLPYQSSNPFLSSNARQYAVQNAYVAFDEAFADLMEQRANEKQQLSIERQLEIERLKKLTQVTITFENQKVLERIEAAKAEAADKARAQKQALQARLEAARIQQEDKIQKMNEDAETRRQRQIDDILFAARTATLARVELEKRIAEGTVGGGKARTREDILRRLDEKTKTFLITGQLVTKHNEVTGPSGRHIYVTPNLEYIVYRHAGQAEVKKSQMMKLNKFLGLKQGPLCKDLDQFRIKAEKARSKNEAKLAQGDNVDLGPKQGEDTPQFITDDEFDPDRIDLPGMHKESMWHGAIPRKGTMAPLNPHYEADDEEIPTQYSDSPYFVLVGIDMSGKEREIGFECENVDTCKKIVRAYNRLYEYSSTLNEFQGDDTMKMVSNPLHNIEQAEKGLKSMVDKERDKSDRIHAWKQSQGIIGGAPQRPQGPSFDDLVGEDDPWE